MKKHITSLIATVFLVGCASYKAKYADKNAPKTVTVNKKIAHSFYLIGDAGNAEMGKKLPSLTFFEQHFNKADKNSTALFLGDNVYPRGVLRKGEEGYELSKYRLQTQIDALKDFKGKPIFIPGNHDWILGVDALKRQEKLVEKALGKGAFLPEGGCGLKKVDINNEITLIVIDSRWYLMDWDDDPKMNDNCDIKTHERFLEELRGLFNKNRYKNVVVAMHHPLYSNGPHGGSFSFIDHMKPAPVLGTLKNLIRSKAGIQTDNFQKQYVDFITQIETLTRDFNNNIVFVSGHEHNLQYIESKGISANSSSNNSNFKQIISGSGSKTSPALVGYGAQFTYGNLGYAILNYYTDGSAIVEFYSANEKDGNKLLFSKEIIRPFKKVDENSFDFSEYNQHKKEVTTSLYPKEAVEKNGFHRFMWGDLNRKKYGEEVTVPVLELDKVFGGLKPIRRGGGNQTNSLRLENKDGKQYVLRSMYKDGSRIMGGVLKNTFLVDVVQDVFTMSHPYAAFVIPDMAEAAGIYHTNPKLYYLPKQPALGKFNDIFGSGMYLLEERPAGNRDDVASFGNSEKIISTFDALEKIRKNGKHSIDQDFAIRSRLFDMVIGDWDRHEDQWRFASFKTDDGKTYYRPIPRDRDQPFSKFDGVLIPTFKYFVPLVKNMQSMDYDIQDMKWYNNYPRFFDAEFLNELTLDDWLKQAKHIQVNLTDKVIENAIKQFPKNVYDIDGKELIEMIKSRRDKLQDIAKRYYTKQAKKVQVVGTDKDDKFIIKRLNDDETSVEVYRKELKVYERIFKTNETKEVQLYGLNGDDEFYISGDVNDGIILRLIGGQNHDIYDDKSSVSGWGKKTKVYDYKSKKNTVKGGRELADLRRDDYYNNTYDHHDIENSTSLLTPSFGSNPDDGFFFGANFTYTAQGFKKRPFASQHSLSTNFYSSTNGFDFSYKGEFTEFIGNWSLGLDAGITSNNYSINFFGWGNNTAFVIPTGNQNNDLDNYRVKKGGFRVSPSLIRRFNAGSIFKVSGIIESVQIQNTAGRFIENFAGATTNIFDTNYFWGGEFNFSHHRVDNGSFPTKGMNFDITLGAKANTDSFSNRFGYFIGKWAIYQNLVPNRSVVWATEVGTQINVGNRFEFYQGANIGGTDNLRGFNNQRFTGKESFYNSNDIRARLGGFKLGIPMKFGVTGGFDLGKVWTPYATNYNRWHTSYGGSIWFSGLDMFTANLSYFQGDLDNENRFAFSLGFAF